MRLNLPNALTLSRIALAFILLALLLSQEIPGANFLAAAVFAIASVTDFLDGYIARQRNLITSFGEIFDPLADKMLILASFIGLLYLQSASAWAIFLILSREFLITGLRVVAISEGKNVSASNLGKTKTVVQGIAIFFLLLNLPYGNALLWLAALITLYSGYEYARSYFFNDKES